MLHLFRLRTSITVGCVISFLPSFLMGCARSPQPPSVLSSWSEQFAAVERAVQATGSDFVLVSGEIFPARDKQGTPDEPIELRVTFLFVSPKVLKVDSNNSPRYPARMVHYNDHKLATSLRVDNDFSETIYPPDSKSGESARLIRLGPQDVLRLTLAEGQTHLKEPVNNQNTVINLVRTSEIPPDVNAPAVWKISYYGKTTLSIWVDAKTGAILKRVTTDN